jgi:hypothetical protein
MVGKVAFRADFVIRFNPSLAKTVRKVSGIRTIISDKTLREPPPTSEWV